MAAVRWKHSVMFVLLPFLWGCAPASWSDALYGTWEGKIGERSVRLELATDGGCRLKLPTGESDVWYSGHCEMNLEKHPIPLTMRQISQLDHPLHTIIELAGPDTLHMAPFASRWRLRPIAFGDQPLVLHRVASADSDTGDA